MKSKAKPSKNLKQAPRKMPMEMPQDKRAIELERMLNFKPQDERAWMRQDKPTKGDAAYVKKHPFSAAMENAAKADQIRRAYRDQQKMNPQDWEWESAYQDPETGDLILKYPKANKQDKPSPFDVKKHNSLRR